MNIIKNYPRPNLVQATPLLINKKLSISYPNYTTNHQNK